MKYSIIVPVYNRPDEVDELLASLCRQSLRDFEVIIVEDGSATPCKDVCDRYSGKLALNYYYKENSGPGQSRNYGAERAEGQYLIVLDSDVVLPEGYLQAVDDELCRSAADAFGGPDRAHESFSDVQKAISYSMTSFFTTGGIRGGKKKLDKFYPRSFNMGIRSDIYRRLGGFSNMRFGEDIDFSIRIYQSGCQCRLFPDAWVWHKRRTDFRKFWRQVYNSGIARINLYKKYPESLKLVHLLPMVFTIGVAMLVVSLLAGLHLWFRAEGGDAISRLAVSLTGLPQHTLAAILLLVGALPLLLYALLIFADSTRTSKSLRVGLLSVPSAFIQLMGYGCGFLSAWWKRCVMGRREFAAFKNTFYK